MIQESEIIMKKKAVFFDIDGTLWDAFNVIPESTVEAISRLRQNGILTFINTGRTRVFMDHPKLLALGFDGIVSGCGTMVELHGETIFLYELPLPVIEETVAITEKYHYKNILEGAKKLYMYRSEFENDFYGQKVIREMEGHLFDIGEFYGKWEISKVSSNTLGTTEEERRLCVEEMSKFYTAIVHNEQVVEFVPHGFSKGTGIEKVCELLDIDIEDTYAVGDSVNDIEMLKTAGHAIVMGNGAPEVKPLAEFVTLPLMEGGIYHAMEHFGLI